MKYNILKTDNLKVDLINVKMDQFKENLIEIQNISSNRIDIFKLNDQVTWGNRIFTATKIENEIIYFTEDFTKIEEKFKQFIKDYEKEITNII